MRKSISIGSMFVFCVNSLFIIYKLNGIIIIAKWIFERVHKDENLIWKQTMRFHRKYLV